MRWILLVIFSFASSGFINPQEIIFAIGDWPPYTNSSENGLATDIVTAACVSVGITYRIIHVPWLRAENYVERGDAFGTFPYAITSQRKIKYLFSDPIFGSSNTIIYNSSNKKIDIAELQSIESFKMFTIGMTTGSDALAVPLRKIGAKVETTETIDLSMKKLQSGRIDFIIEDSYVINELLKQYQDARIVVLNKKILFLDREYCLMVTKRNKNSQDIIELFNKGIRKIKSSGEYGRIIVKYQEQ
ncbi:MAG: transporter substrate-binding domain-containing protein [Deltaproteobacteria bacterium]|nr:transporter substrate-binding domain-containing protein [Deltaproteobacteria bacterium]